MLLAARKDENAHLSLNLILTLHFNYLKINKHAYLRQITANSKVKGTKVLTK